jgi:hypothetical protein
MGSPVLVPVILAQATRDFHGLIGNKWPEPRVQFYTGEVFNIEHLGMTQAQARRPVLAEKADRMPSGNWARLISAM